MYGFVDDSPEAIANAYELAFLRLERDEGPVNFDDAAEREKCRDVIHEDADQDRAA